MGIMKLQKISGAKYAWAQFVNLLNAIFVKRVYSASHVFKKHKNKIKK